MRIAEKQRYALALDPLKRKAINFNAVKDVRAIESELFRSRLGEGTGKLSVEDTRWLFQLPADKWAVSGEQISGRYGNIDDSKEARSRPLGPFPELRFSFKILSTWYHAMRVKTDDQSFVYSHGHWKNANAMFKVDGKDRRLPGVIPNPEEWAELTAVVKDGKIQFFYNRAMVAESPLKPMPPGGYTFIVGFASHECDVAIQDVVISMSGEK